MKTGKKNKFIFEKPSKFFLKLFLIPSICWIVLMLFAMIPDETDPDPLTWGEYIYANGALILIWFVISYVIALIVKEATKNKPNAKIIKEVHYIEKSDEKVSVKSELKDESKKGLRKQSNNKCLYTCESIIDGYEYKKMVKYFPQIYWAYVFWITFLNLLISAIIAIVSKSFVTTLGFFTVYQLFIMILYKVRLEYYAERSFNKMVKNGTSETKLHTEFYDDYFIRQGETSTFKIKYDDIVRCVETDTNFYLKWDKESKIIFIQKNACELELIHFIRSKFNNLESYIGNDKKVKPIRKSHNPVFVKNGMIILFIITIASFWGASYSVSLVDKINPKHGFSFVKNAWVFWCWLPVPILSIILGFKYKRVGYKCTKNIIGGFIIGFLLLLYGLFYFFPTYSRNYEELNNYKYMIDATLPANGDLEIQEVGTYFDDDKTDYVVINVYYDKEDTTNLESSIKNSNKWILSNYINSNLKVVVPSIFYSGDDIYYSLYNKTLNVYNSLPSNSGEYEMYAMKYSISNKMLEIHKFKYKYVVDDKNEKQFIKTYYVLNVSDSNNGNDIYLTLKQFQRDEVVTVKIDKSINNNIIKDKYYEFTFNNTSKNIEDNIKSIFENANLISIKETDKVGLAQIQDSIK